MKKNIKISVIGLGYVGLPLAVEFSKKYRVIGFDINKERVSNLKIGIDETNEVDQNELTKSQNITDQKGLLVTDKVDNIETCNIHIITVPTPVDENFDPDLKPIKSATKMIANILKKDDVVIYETTVYPGLTEEICIPILEQISGLKYNLDFFAGYSPERINPGDKKRTLTKIVKVTSGSNQETAKLIDDLYKTIITAGTHLAPSIKVAEAAKVIENSQRDINIAFVNELSKIFNLMDIDTNDVLEAASTKWNFLKFKPGLVGGHCIGVDPYYLANKAISLGYNPEIILSGRKMNNSMGNHVVDRIISLMKKKNIKINNAEALVLGITFKENCPDVRNTKVVDVINGLKHYNIKTDVYDPNPSYNEVLQEFDIKLTKDLIGKSYDIIVLAVAHNQFKVIEISKLLKSNSVVYDVKGFLNYYDERL